jgi:hypothetical protein
MGGWFIPALLASDLFLLGRTLSRQDFARYISIIIVIALLTGLVMPGMLVMIGYALTAAGIVNCGLLFRKKAVCTGLE